MDGVQVLGRGQGSSTEFDNGTFVVKCSDSFVSPGRVVGELTVHPGFAGPGLHRHSDVAELFYVLEGSVTFVVEGEAVNLTSGMTMEIPAGQLHNFSNSSDSVAKLLIVGSKDEVLLYASK